MNKPASIYALALMLTAACVLGPVASRVEANTPLDLVVLRPGDSRSLTFRYHNSFGGSRSIYNVVVVATSPDGEIQRLRIAVNPVGDIGSEISFFTWGIFAPLSGGFFRFLELLEPKSTSGFEYASYIVDVNPPVTVGYIFVSAGFVFSSFEFPLLMSMTLTLEN